MPRSGMSICAIRRNARASGSQPGENAQQRVLLNKIDTLTQNLDGLATLWGTRYRKHNECSLSGDSPSYVLCRTSSVVSPGKEQLKHKAHDGRTPLILDVISFHRVHKTRSDVKPYTEKTDFLFLIEKAQSFEATSKEWAKWLRDAILNALVMDVFPRLSTFSGNKVSKNPHLNTAKKRGNPLRRRL